MKISIKFGARAVAGLVGVAMLVFPAVTNAATSQWFTVCSYGHPDQCLQYKDDPNGSNITIAPGGSFAIKWRPAPGSAPFSCVNTYSMEFPDGYEDPNWNNQNNSVTGSAMVTPPESVAGMTWTYGFMPGIETNTGSCDVYGGSVLTVNIRASDSTS